MNHVPRWRIAAALIVLAGLGWFALKFTPIYIRDRQLESFVADIAARPGTPAKSDEALRAQVLDRAHALNLPVTPGDVKILRSQQGLRIDVRYVVRVAVPGYTVDLHFDPGAGSR